jgi:transposase
MKITTIGIDLAKRSYSVHGVDAHGEVMLRKSLSRTKLLELMATLEACLVGMEACGGAHDMARRLTAMGHTVRLMAAKFVHPYRKSQKNDGNDAEAICKAVGRPSMRFVAVKSAEQQALLTVHRVRGELVQARTALVNQLCGLPVEFGVVMPKGRYQLRAQVGGLAQRRAGAQLSTRSAQRTQRAHTRSGRRHPGLRPASGGHRPSQRAGPAHDGHRWRLDAEICRT